MTISSNVRKAGPFTGTGTTGPFTFSFKVFTTADIYAVKLDTATGIETVLALTTDYTASINANQDTSPGGTITLISALAAGYTLTISSVLDYLQPTDLTNQGGFYPSVITDALDRATIQIQQLKEQVDRSTKLPISSTANADTLSVAVLAVAADLTNVDAVATNITNVNTAAINIVDVNTVAANVVDVTNFAGVYYGPSATDPTTRHDGSALQTGDLYFNTGASSGMKVYDGARWQEAGSAMPITLTADTFNGTGAETAFTLSASAPSVNSVSVFISGVRQVPTTDYTVIGTALTFGTAPPSGTGNIFCLTTTPVQVGVPNDGSVTSAKLASGAVEGKITAALSNRNKLINGAMAIDQRNAGAAQTITAAAALAYTVDRWYGYCTGANVTGQRVAGTAPNQYNYRYTGAASVTKIGHAQRVEAANCQDLAGTTATLAVDLANSLLTTVTWTAWYANTADTFGTLASPTRTQISTGTFTVNSTLARYSTNISIPAAATTGIEVEFSVGAQTSGTWTIGRAQLEAGAVATPFEYRSVSNELEMCQRYYSKSYSTSVVPGTVTDAGSSRTIGTGNAFAINFDLPVEMRTAPTVTAYAPATGASGYITDVSAGNVAPTINTSTRHISMHGGGTNATYIYGHYVAVSEL